jgi:hypothetical protein
MSAAMTARVIDISLHNVGPIENSGEIDFDAAAEARIGATARTGSGARAGGFKLTTITSRPQGQSLLPNAPSATNLPRTEER